METKYKKYVKNKTTEARPYIPGEDISGVTVSEGDYPPKAGDMIARDASNPSDQWLISEKYFKENYREA